MDARRNGGAAAGKAYRPRSGTFAVIGCGPSLEQWQCDYIRDKATVITTNAAWTKFRDNPTLAYAGDLNFWEYYHEEIKAAGFECWTQHQEAAARFDLNYVKLRTGAGLCKTYWRIHNGGNSGYQSMNMAYHMGAERIILLGMDMKAQPDRDHFHPDHPYGKSTTPFAWWLKKFPPIATDLAAEGVEVINCSTDTAIECFKRADLRDVL